MSTPRNLYEPPACVCVCVCLWHYVIHNGCSDYATCVHVAQQKFKTRLIYNLTGSFADILLKLGHNLPGIIYSSVLPLMLNLRTNSSFHLVPELAVANANRCNCIFVDSFFYLLKHISHTPVRTVSLMSVYDLKNIRKMFPEDGFCRCSSLLLQRRRLSSVYCSHLFGFTSWLDDIW